MKKLFILFMVLALGNAKAQDIQVSSIPFPTDEVTPFITGMTQDQQGYLWFATLSRGLIRYDGENLKRFSNERDNPNSLIANRLECIETGHDGAIWIGTFSQGLVRFDPITETFTNYQHDPANPHSIRSDAIRAIAPEKEGGLWIGTFEGIDYFDPKTGIFNHGLGSGPDARLLQKEHVRVFYFDKSGILWAGTSSTFFSEETQGGLFRINPQTREVKRYYHTSENNSLIDNHVSTIFEDSNGTFWVGTAGDGLHTMDRKMGTFTRHTYDPSNPNKLSRPPVNNFTYAADHIRFITEDMEGGIWIGTMGNGVNRYDLRDKTIRHFGTKEAGQYHLPTDNFWTCLKTKDNLLWLGAWIPTANDQILTKINLAPTHVFRGIFTNRVYGFEEGESGVIYMGANDAIYQIDSNDTWKIIFQSTSPPIGQIDHLLKDKQGNLWVSSFKGLHYFDVKTGQLTSYALNEKEAISRASKSFNVSAFINKDSLLVGSEDGLFLFDITRKKFTYIRQPTSSDKNQNIREVRDIFVDSHKNIWVGYRFLGLKKLDLKSGTFKDYTSIKNTIAVSGIFEDASGNLFAGGTRWGLRKYDSKRDEYTLIKDKSGLLNADSDIWDITQVGDSTLWLNTGLGLVKYNKTTNTAFLYGESWGLSPLNILSFQLFKSSRDEIYLGTVGGYLKCRLEDFERKPGFEPQPIIARFSAGEQGDLLRKDSARQTVQLQYDQNNISLTLGYINYLTTGVDKSLQYRLEPYDDNWRSGRNSEQVFYYKLPPGEYQFRLRAMDIYGEWSETSLTFSVAPPWWRTWWAYTLYGLCLVAGIYFVDRFQRKRLLEKERAKARERELAQAREIEKAYTELKLTQAQLIQSEKMASLGELTAGIAHEIQNPLNFVNNYSEVNAELIEEIKEEIEKGNLPEIKAIVADLEENEAKIHHHGQRADSIVRSMMQHSRTNSGTKEPTNLNALADEYLRLAYQSMKAKDSDFEAEFSTDFDETLPMVEVVQQDIGRVLLNIINNAFQACAEKQKKQMEGYYPSVKVTTRKLENSVEITITDNGPGIPEAIKDKIFQPFFTTRPTGQGTGLGLSLAYDIVKAHGGKINVESTEGKGVEFIITLPTKINGL